MKYDYKAVEAKWQKVWEDEKTFHVEIDHKKPKFYALVEFPYPSGAGLHVGHPRSYTALDVVSRKRRQNGYNVLYPMGWDAFGLPTENFAMKNHIHPAIVTKKNVDHFREQLKALGFSFDWDREINTTDPEYYKWTQWIFLQLYKKGLAYKKEMNVNWCTGCKCVLANEEVVNGVCERCGSEVVHRVKSQWMLKITAYADKLIDGLDGLDYIERVATQQKNWIGRSHGAEVNFGTTAGDTLTVYTTRCDTLFGATYMVVSPEHAMVKEWLEKGIIKNADAVKAYQAEAARKSDFERSELNKEKTGVKLEGVMGINPVNDKEIPIFISDYVLATYGTGAIMAVPAHDTRDEAAFTDVATGTLVNSGFLDGLSVADAKKKMIEWLEGNGKGKDKVNYKLRDWVFSRQRYWGEPIPMVKCEKCGWQPLPERPRYPRDRHHAPVGRFLLVLPALYGPPLQGRHRFQGGAGILVSGGLVQRRHGAHYAASAVQPVLAQVPVRHRCGPFSGTLPEAHCPWHDPRPEPPQLRQPARRGAGQAAEGVRQPEGRRKGSGRKVR